ncbi:MAG: hypothetical protein JSU87_01070 [Gemmatimonadota bacterium]|nr:MAG: hypothetical protein JSU87_01070 [Gemmatimonadota bacterium]
MMSRCLASLVLVLLVACTDEATQPESVEFGPLPDRSVRVNIVAAPQGEGITVTRLLIDSRSLEIGAYQGRFRFDPEALELIDVKMPEDNYRFVNVNGAPRGEIRFAGFTVTAFESPVALEMRFRSRGAVDLDDMAVDLEVVGDIEGNKIERQRIVEPSRTFAR